MANNLFSLEYQSEPNTINPESLKVGIGTSTPQYVLDVNGTARIASNFYATSGIGTTYPSSIAALLQ